MRMSGGASHRPNEGPARGSGGEVSRGAAGAWGGGLQAFGPAGCSCPKNPQAGLVVLHPPVVATNLSQKH